MIRGGEYWAMSVENMMKLERTGMRHAKACVLSDCKTDSRMQTCGTDLALIVLEIL